MARSVSLSTSTSVSTFGKYTLIADLGRGGMASVSLAVLKGPGGFQKLRVVKLMKESISADPAMVSMFLDEARLAARFGHPNIVQTNEVGTQDGQLYIDMEYLEGESLLAVERRCAATAAINGLLPLPLTLYVLGQMLSGLHYAHTFKGFDGKPLSVVHRDVSPHNVIVTYDGQVKILDFGIAKASTRSNETETGILKGKVAFMAPEQIASSKSVDARIDIFASGVVLYELLTGERLWPNKTDLTILHALAGHNVPRLSDHAPKGVPADVVALCDRALAPYPGDRFADAAEMRTAVDAALRNLGASPGASDLAACMDHLFAEERRVRRQLLDEQLSRVEAPSSGGGGKAMLLASNGSSTAGLDLGLRRPTLTTTSSVQGMVSTAHSAQSPARRRKLPTLSLVGLASVALVALIVGRATRATPTHSLAATPAAFAASLPSAAALSPASRVAEAKMVTVRLEASPASARIVLDDAPASSNPFEAQLPSDELTHRVKVYAPGHKSRAEVVTFLRDVSLRIVLEAEPAPPTPTARVARAASAAPLQQPQAVAASVPGPAPPPERSRPQPPKASGKPTFDNTDPWR